jgi:hypothetical protein
MIDKKKLKEQYKSMVPPKGIYCVKNIQNGKIFLASSLNLKGVLNKHKMQLAVGTHFNTSLQQDWNVFGENAFNFEILEELEIKEDPSYDYEDDLKLLEMIWLEKFPPLSEYSYNKTEKIRTV